MKPLPDLQDVEAMAAIGRTSALWSARNKTVESLRDVFTEIQSADWMSLDVLACEAKSLSDRLKTIAEMWNTLMRKNEP